MKFPARVRSLLKTLGLFPQLEFLDFAGRRLRQGAEDHGLGRLEVGDVVAAECDDVFFGGGFAGLEGDECFG